MSSGSFMYIKQTQRCGSGATESMCRVERCLRATVIFQKVARVSEKLRVHVESSVQMVRGLREREVEVD